MAPGRQRYISSPRTTTGARAAITDSKHHYLGPLHRPTHSRLYSPVSGLHDILYLDIVQADRFQYTQTMSENGHHINFWIVRISIHVFRPVQRRENFPKVHGLNSKGVRLLVHLHR